MYLHFRKSKLRSAQFILSRRNREWNSSYFLTSCKLKREILSAPAFAESEKLRTGSFPLFVPDEFKYFLKLRKGRNGFTKNGTLPSEWKFNLPEKTGEESGFGNPAVKAISVSLHFAYVNSASFGNKLFHGFLPVPTNFLPQPLEFILRIHSENVKKTGFFDMKKWYLSFGDSDVF